MKIGKQDGKAADVGVKRHEPATKRRASSDPLKRHIDRYHALVDLYLSGTITPKQQSEMDRLNKKFDKAEGADSFRTDLAIRLDGKLEEALRVLRQHDTKIKS